MNNGHILVSMAHWFGPDFSTLYHVLAGGTPQTATIALEDITDIDVRETIGPVSKGECTMNTLVYFCHFFTVLANARLLVNLN